MARPAPALLSVAEEIAGLGFRGIYVDAVSPESVRAVARVAAEGGARYVNGGISLVPRSESRARPTCVSLGTQRRRSPLFEGSALKICYVT